jgi:hypothetical protein
VLQLSISLVYEAAASQPECSPSFLAALGLPLINPLSTNSSSMKRTDFTDLKDLVRLLAALLRELPLSLPMPCPKLSVLSATLLAALPSRLTLNKLSMANWSATVFQRVVKDSFEASSALRPSPQPKV